MGERICSIPGCGKRAVARGWCSRHYGKWHAHGDPLHVTQRDKTPEQRFWEKVVESGDCWEWTGGKDYDGYGIHSVGRSEEHTSELQSRGHLVCRLLHEENNVRVVIHVARQY